MCNYPLVFNDLMKPSISQLIFYAYWCQAKKMKIQKNKQCLHTHLIAKSMDLTRNTLNRQHGDWWYI